MRIETSINTTLESREALFDAAHASGRTLSWIVIQLMKQMMKNYRALVRSHQNVQRQDPDKDEQWHAVHICMDTRDHDLFMDMRKFFRRTVSLLVAMAIREYLHRWLRKLCAGKLNEITDNYPFNNYFIVLHPMEGALCWKIYWGKPVNTRLLPPT